jgi:hypothetical protein
MEDKLHRIAESLGIELSEALAAGLHFYIRLRIADSDRRLTPVLLKDFQDLEELALKDLKAYIRLKDEEQATLEMVTESLKPEPTVEVWSPDDEAYIRIPKSQFDAQPGAWTRRATS